MANATDANTQTSIRYVIHDTSRNAEAYSSCSKEYKIGILSWRLTVQTKPNETDKTKYLCVFVSCNEHTTSTLWSCEASLTLTLRCEKENMEWSRKYQTDFNFYNKKYGPIYFIEWSKFTDPNNFYFCNGRATIVVDISVQKSHGYRSFPSMIDFTVAGCPSADAVFLIDDVRLHVSKSYLSLYSPVFKAMFFGEFRERDLDKIQLNDVVLSEFVEFLHVLYPSHTPVNQKNVKFLLQLGEKFNVNFVLSACEKFLMETRSFPMESKLVLADRYQLASLQDACICTLTTVGKVKLLKHTKEYVQLSDSSKTAILERYFELTE